MLTENQIRKLVSKGELFDVEFKGEEREALNDAELVETVVCLANGRGGVLLVGVEDDGRYTGARPRHGTITDPRRVEALVANRTVPSVPASCQVLNVDGSDVIAIEIPSMQQPVATSSGLAKRRAIAPDGTPACVPYHFYEMQAAQANRGAQDYSSLTLPNAKWEDLDPLELERLRQTIHRNPGRADRSLLALSDSELVRTLGLGNGGEGSTGVDRLHVAAILLLGREEAIRSLVPTHEVAFQVLSGTKIVVNDFFRWPLIRVAEEFDSRFQARNQEVEISIGPVRAGIPDYSRNGFREALHNALIHRDYTQLGAVHIQWRDDNIEISNPGGFVEGVSLDNLLVTAPKPRNPVLAEAFKRIGLVERTGRGIAAVYEGQLRYGRPAPDYTRSSRHEVQVILPGGPANLELARWFIEQESPEAPVTVEEMILVNAVERERRLDIAHAAELLQRDEQSARALLERLVERGVFEGQENRRLGRVYSLSAATYRALGDAAAYARNLDFEPIQQEQMVLQFVTAHGKITRRDAADLCKIDSRDARALLARLVRRGELVLRGQKRGSYYERPPGADLFSP